MLVLFVSLAAVCFLFGLAAMIGAPSIMQEIAGMILWLCAVAFVSTATIVHELRKIQQRLAGLDADEAAFRAWRRNGG